MIDKPKVSVILPVYNASRYLEQCIESLLSQTLSNLEIICVDDCSTDNSLNLLEGLRQKDNRIKIIKQSANLGAGSARNAGMEIASGEYLSFLDADDYFAADMFKIAIEHADTLNLDVMVFGAKAFNDETGDESDMSWAIKEHLLPELPVFCAGDIKEDFFQTFIWWAWDKLFRKSYIDQHQFKFQEIRTSNDLLFTASAMLMAEKIAFTKEPLVYQRQKINTSLSSTRHLSYNCCLQATIALKEFMQHMQIYERFERDFKNYALNFLIWNINTIGQDAYSALYNLVKQFFSTLEISREDIFYQPFYDAYLFILDHSAEEYLFYLRMKLGQDIEESHDKIALTQREVDDLINQVNCLTLKAESAQLALEDIQAAKELLINEHEGMRAKYEADISEHEGIRVKYEDAIVERDQKLEEQHQLIERVSKGLQEKNAELKHVYASKSWMITAPLRWVLSKFK